LTEAERQEMYKEYRQLREELTDHGKFITGSQLLPTSTAQSVRVRNGKPLTMDGPFAETKELIAGYWIWNVKSLQEAIDWVKRVPAPENIDDTQEGEIEIRPIFEASDFVSDFAPDIKNQTDRMRDHIEKQKTS